MSLDSRYIIASDLQSLFRDKDSGLPLRNGVIYFWADEARTVPKDVFQLSGSPPNYSYTNLGAVINLTAIGTMSNNVDNNDIILYYFPYDSNGNVQLYYVQVFSEGGISHGTEQWTREAWPNFTSATTGSEDFVNYVPNGQFLLHNDIPADPENNIVFGQITQPITILSQGGWTFERPEDSTATDIVTFVPFGSAVTNPSANPKFGLRVNTQMPNAGDTFKDARLKFPDVNKFASDTQQYTFALSGISNTVNNQTLQLILIKNFGSGGSATTETTLATFTITPSYKISQVSFVFGTNLDKTIGANNDDYLQLAIRYPVGSVSDITITDVIDAPGAFTINTFPATPNNEFNYRSIAGWLPTPAYDGSDLYLPLKMTQAGLIADHSEIGDVVQESNIQNYTNGISTITNRLLPNGAQYATDGYSALGIPFKRLQQFWWNSTVNCPLYGTGPNYFTVFSPFNGATMTVSNNLLGTSPDPADGTVATGFTFTTNAPIANTTISSVMYAANSFLVLAGVTGAIGVPTAGTSGFTVGVFRSGSPVNKEIDYFVAVAATSLAGTYFTFNLYPTANFYVWFKVSGSGADPAHGGTGILVNLLTGDTAAIVAQKCFAALNLWQYSTITTVGGSVLPAGSYFTINSITSDYYVWYTVDGTGTDPKPSGKIAIPVAVLSTDTNIQIATKTQIAMNSKYFAVPNWPGVFLRNVDNVENIIDIDVRTSYVPGITGNQLGTIEFDDLRSHTHGTTAVTDIVGQDGGTVIGDSPDGIYDFTGGSDFGLQGLSATTTVTVDPFGGNETTPLNANVNIAIKY